jgi:FixJ family two-component response regulator
MPKLSGIDLVKRLRDERPDLPVVMISGYPEAGGEGSAIPDDVTFLLKPFEPGQLCRALADALREKSDDDLTKAD